MGLISFLTRRHADYRSRGHGESRVSLADPTVCQGAHGRTGTSWPSILFAPDFNSEGGRPVTQRGLSSPWVSEHQVLQQSSRKKSQPQLTTAVKPFFLGIRDDERPSPVFGEANRADSLRLASPWNILDGTWTRSFPLSRRDPHVETRAVPASVSNSHFLAMTRPTAESKGGVDGAVAAPSRPTRSVDILEAQSEIKPYSFKSRLQASGIRDYGEDVAERNLAQNALGLPTPAVRTCHTSVIGGSPSTARVVKSPTTGQRSSPLAQSTEQPRRHITIAASEVKGRRPRSLDPMSLDSAGLDPTTLLASLASNPQLPAPRAGRFGTGSPSTIDEELSEKTWALPHWMPGSENSKRKRRPTTGTPWATGQYGSGNRSASPPYVPRHRPQSVHTSDSRGMGTLGRFRHSLMDSID